MIYLLHIDLKFYRSLFVSKSWHCYWSCGKTCEIYCLLVTFLDPYISPIFRVSWTNFVLCFGHFFSCKWNKNDSGFRPPLCTYRLNWARRTFWGLWDEWDDTVLQTQDSKLEPWRSEADQAASRSRRLPTILTFTHGWGRNIFSFF